MSNDLERIGDAVATLLGGGATDKEVIINRVQMIASTPQYTDKITGMIFSK